jgi:5,10-methylene-tetrahydrofolate dehydrogenase/methenyl tetrahydrofolate cyclohydrolase
MTEEEFDNYLDSLSLDELQSLAGELGIQAEETAIDDTMSEEEVENLIAELNND